MRCRDESVKLICCCLYICISAKSNLKTLVLSAPSSGGLFESQLT